MRAEVNPTFLWHDYETFGAYPSLDRPAQFAALRTNAALEPVDDPVNWFCKPALDILPHPVASLITGITPQTAQQNGLIEAEFAGKIHAEMMEPNTCGAGYNSIRFDDEFSRNLFYRNFIDPYEREYRNENSRWDLIDLARMCYALRPDGIEWPEHEAGRPSFKLEHLSAANNIQHKGAHEALSDVTATIDLARLLKTRQPRLFDWALKMRNQGQVLQILNIVDPQPVVHTSARIPARRGCTTLVLPVSIYPDRPKSVIVFDLMTDPEPLLGSSAEEIKDRLFTPAGDLPTGVKRIQLKAVHTNHVPMIAPVATLGNTNCQRIGLNPELCFTHAEMIKADLQNVRAKVMEVFSPQPFTTDGDPDHMIYSGGFFAAQDRKLMTRIRNTKPGDLGQEQWPFSDSRLAEMLFRYRARNFPDKLTNVERQKWETERLDRLAHPADARQLTPETFAVEISAARQACDGSDEEAARSQFILDQLEVWGAEICRTN